MKKLPILITLPHCSNRVPQSVRSRMQLSDEEIARYFDSGSEVIYASEDVHLLPARFSRLVVDLNRAPDHIAGTTMKNRSGVILQKTYWGKEIYMSPLSDAQYEEQLQIHHQYYQSVKDILLREHIQFFLAGHTMYSFPLGRNFAFSQGQDPTKGEDEKKRPDIVLSNNNFVTCSQATIMLLKTCFEQCGYRVQINTPFSGGFLLNYFCHRDHLPGVQIEFRMGNFLDEQTFLRNEQKLQEHHQKVTQGILSFWYTYTASNYE